MLIVEDHAALRAGLCELLGLAFPGHEILEAGSAEEALNLAFITRPEIVLMDIGLPGMNGIQATRQLKSHLPHTRVVMISIQETDHYQSAALQAGASAYLFKRTLHSELVPTVMKLLTNIQSE